MDEHEQQQIAVSRQSHSTMAWAEQLLDDANGRLGPEERAFLRSQLTSPNGKPDPQMLPPDPSVPTIVRDHGALRTMAEKIATEEMLAFDIETSDLDARTGEIVSIGVAGTDETFYVPLMHRFEQNNELRPDQLALGVVVQELKLGDRPLVAHNAKFEFKWMQRHAGITCRFVWDTMIAARLLRSDLSGAELKDVAQRELDVPDWGLPKADMNRIQYLPIDRVARYCAKDCYYTRLLWEKQGQCLA